MAGVVVPPISDHMYGDLHSIQFQYNSPVVNSSWASMPASGFPQVVLNSNGSATMGGAQSEPADILGGNFNEQEAIGLRNSVVATTQSENCFDYAIMATLPSTSEAFSQAGSTANHEQSDILISHVLDAEAMPMPHVSPDGQPCIADYELGSASPLAGMETLSVLNNRFKAQDCSMLPACHEEPLHPLSGSHMKLLQREAAYAAAAMQPVDWGSTLNVDVGARPKRRNVRISQDPQTASARRRRERISDRIRVLQRMVPGGMKMDTASLLDEAIHYLKYLKSQVQTLEWLEKSRSSSSTVNRLTSGSSCPSAYSGSYASFVQHSGSRTLLQMIK